jgi:hypothetical protein
LNCRTGEATTRALAVSHDITSTWAEFDPASRQATFYIQIGGVEQIDREFAGGIEFAYPGQPVVDDPYWYFSTIGYNSVNFSWMPPDRFDIYRTAVGPDGWQGAHDSRVSGALEGNTVRLEVPFDEILPDPPVPLPEALFWFATTTDFNVCDAAGEDLSLFIQPQLIQSTDE